MENVEVAVNSKIKVTLEGGGIVNSIGWFATAAYTWYLWGTAHDFLSLGFIVYLIVIFAVLFLPKTILATIQFRDGVFSVLEQVIYHVFCIVSVYFAAPFVIKGIVAAFAN